MVITAIRINSDKQSPSQTINVVDRNKTLNGPHDPRPIVL